MSGVDELRRELAEALLTCLDSRNPLYYEDAADECADAVLPVVTAWHEAEVERVARQWAAEELSGIVAWARANRLGNLTVDALHRQCCARAAALADDGRA